MTGNPSHYTGFPRYTGPEQGWTVERICTRCVVVGQVPGTCETGRTGGVAKPPPVQVRTSAQGTNMSESTRASNAHGPSTAPDWALDQRAPWDRCLWSAPLADPVYRQQVWDRIMGYIKVSDSGCWEWLRFLSPDGYGRVSIKSRMVGAHIITVAVRRGFLWPGELQLDHLCRNRACCNPAHLELVTAIENTRRGKQAEIARARAEEARKRRTHCKHGHPFDVENTYVHPIKGHRLCRRCRADGMRRAAMRKRSA